VYAWLLFGDIMDTDKNQPKKEVIVCPDCVGYGFIETGDDKIKKCEKCDGSGRIYNPEEK
jgi:DnaJ-class molecular chaperone